MGYASRLLPATAMVVGSTREVSNETSAKRLHADRTDDRGCDHRHSGRRRTSGVPGLHDPRQDVGDNSRNERLPYVDHRGVPVGRVGAGRRRLGLRSQHHRGLEVRDGHHHEREWRRHRHGAEHQPVGEHLGGYADPAFIGGYGGGFRRGGEPEPVMPGPRARGGLTVQSISPSVNTSVVTLTPLSSAATAATFVAGGSQSLYGWSCGGAGTTVPLKYLPGSCRGG